MKVPLIFGNSQVFAAPSAKVEKPQTSTLGPESFEPPEAPQKGALINPRILEGPLRGSLRVPLRDLRGIYRV